MGLSNELISQFAKITNDKKTSRVDEVTLYGEVVQCDDSVCVRFDGSEQLTPVTTITEKDEQGNITNFKYGAASVKTGDRVSVNLKNHSATITGNLSDPPMGRAEFLVNEDSIIAKVGEEVSLKIDALGVKVNGLTTFTNDLSEGLANGTTVINGGCIQTGIIDAQYINLTGAIVFKDLASDVTDELNDISDIANDATTAANAAADAANAAQIAADNAASAASSAQNTADNAVSIAQSITIPDYIHSTYIDGTEIRSPTIKGNDISVYGTFQTIGHDGASLVTTGYMGAAKGLDALGNTTLGVALSNQWNSSSYAVGNNYVLVTNGGVRLQAGSNRIVVTANSISLTADNGKAYYNGTEIGSGSGGTVVPVWG